MKRDGKGGRVLVVGSANMDMVVSTERFPRPGETVLGGDFGMYPGGKGANQAVACARLGGRVSFLGKMGADVFRDRLLDSLRADGVDVDCVQIHPERATGVALITVDETGQNQIIVASGSNMALSAEDVDRHEHLFAASDVVMLQLEIPLGTVMRAAVVAKRHGAQVMLNPAPAADLPDELLKQVDVITPNESEAELLTGTTMSDGSSATAARTLLDKGVRDVVLTLGARGALHAGASGSRQHPAYQVDAVDTTAAGDAFNGALAYSLGRGDDLEEAIPFANAVAACCVRRKGAQTSMPTLEEVERLQQEQSIAAAE